MHLVASVRPSVRPSVCLFALSRLNQLTCDLHLLHGGRPCNQWAYPDNRAYFIFFKSWCHIKKRAGVAKRARPSFGMTTTQDIMDLFA